MGQACAYRGINSGLIKNEMNEVLILFEVIVVLVCSCDIVSKQKVIISDRLMIHQIGSHGYTIATLPRCNLANLAICLLRTMMVIGIG